jgi:hypothetical protein
MNAKYLVNRVIVAVIVAVVCMGVRAWIYHLK